MLFFLQNSLPLTFWNLNEYKAEDHAWPTEFLYEMCSEIFFKMGGLMSNLWKCTNQLFGAAQPIVMYKPEQWTRPYHLWEGGCTCFWAWGLSRFLFMFTPYLHNFALCHRGSFNPWCDVSGRFFLKTSYVSLIYKCRIVFKIFTDPFLSYTLPWRG